MARMLGNMGLANGPYGPWTRKYFLGREKWDAGKTLNLRTRQLKAKTMTALTYLLVGISIFQFTGCSDSCGYPQDEIQSYSYEYKGKVLDQETEEPIEGASVWINDKHFSKTTKDGFVISIRNQCRDESLNGYKTRVRMQGYEEIQSSYYGSDSIQITRELISGTQHEVVTFSPTRLRKEN